MLGVVSMCLVKCSGCFGWGSLRAWVRHSSVADGEAVADGVAEEVRSTRFAVAGGGAELWMALQEKPNASCHDAGGDVLETACCWWCRCVR